MSIDKILQYQTYDMKLNKLENELKNSSDAVNIRQCQAINKQCFDNLVRMNDGAEVTMENIRKNIIAVEQTSKQIDEIANSDLADCDEKQLDYFAKQLEKLGKTLEELERDIVRANKELNETNINQKKEYEKATKAAMGYKVASESFSEFKKLKSAEAAPIVKQLKELEKDIAPELLDRYKRVKANKRVPVFVPLVKPNGCGGCGMEIANDIMDKLHEKNVQECPNCGRLIYIKE